MMLSQADVLDYDSDSNTSETTRSFYHRNALGSVMEITEMDQQVAVSYRYSPYGEPSVTRGGTSQSTDPLGQHRAFAGRLYDEETGVYENRARSFAPAVGRFAQRDPLSYGPSANLYAYVGSSPVNVTDPLGLFAAGVHSDMTYKACLQVKVFGIREWCCRMIARENADQDTIANAMWGSRPEEHFTSFTNDPQASLDFLNATHAQMCELNNCGGGFCRQVPLFDRCNAIYKKIGEYLHAIQDFYAHTNYVAFLETDDAVLPWDGSSKLPSGSDRFGNYGFKIASYFNIFNQGTHEHSNCKKGKPLHEQAVLNAAAHTYRFFRRAIVQTGLFQDCCQVRTRGVYGAPIGKLSWEDMFPWLFNF